MWPAIIGAAGSLMASGMNNMSAQKSADISYARQKELMALQQKYAVENWNREANYNDPKEQMKRLKEAGLNPNLVYNNGAAGLQAPSTSAPTAPSAPMAQTIPMANPMAEAAQAALAMNQAKRANSETIRQDIENTYLADTIQASLNETLSRIEVNKQNKDKLAAEIPNIAKQGSLLDSQINEISEKVTASQWHRISEYIQTVVDARLKGEQADQIAKLTPALLRMHNAKAALDEAFEKVAGLAGDPQKSVDLLHDWLDTIGDELSKGVDYILVKAGLKPNDGAHDQYVKENGSTKTKPHYWRPRYNQ